MKTLSKLEDLTVCTVKKGLSFFPSQPGCHSPSSFWPGIIQLSPAGESLVRDIPTGDEKNYNLFLQCALSVTRREGEARDDPRHELLLDAAGEVLQLLGGGGSGSAQALQRRRR
jgi:hypothetical protein